MSGLTERALLMDRDNFQAGAIHGVLGFIPAGNTLTEHGLRIGLESCTHAYGKHNIQSICT
jgi:hypothetical protein